MRKTLLTISLILLSVAFIYGTADAITGVCSNCHTMHNSQNGSAEAQVYSGGTLSTSTAPLELLLKGDCMSCHTSTATATIATTGAEAPIVFNTGGYPTGGSTATTPLAGGNFYGDGTNASIHNVDFLGTSTDTLGDVPPGGVDLTQQLTCAGQFGCHGDRTTGNDNYAAVKGAHHGNDTSGGVISSPSDVGGSYRFLDGIEGAEDSDWEQTNGSTDHNGYSGDTAALDADSADATISELCGQCHGNSTSSGFHSTSGVGSSSPWLRHPTDVNLAASGSSPFTTDYTTYNTETPVAFSTPSTTESAVGSSSIVICLSCHRAHGSEQPDLLRFDYSLMIAGDGATNGCLRCHELQR